MSAFDLRVEEDGLAVMTFDLPGQRVNKLSADIASVIPRSAATRDPFSSCSRTRKGSLAPLGMTRDRK
jgi:hypothetical protein